jgi:hypothetical protein
MIAEMWTGVEKWQAERLETMRGEIRRLEGVCRDLERQRDRADRDRNMAIGRYNELSRQFERVRKGA